MHEPAPPPGARSARTSVLEPRLPVESPITPAPRSTVIGDTVPTAQSQMAEALAHIEAVATASSLPRLTDGDLSEAMGLHLLASQAMADGDLARFADLGSWLHRILVRGCPNDRVRELLDEEKTLLRALSTTVEISERECRRAAADHLTLLILAEQDPTSVEIAELLRRHPRNCH